MENFINKIENVQRKALDQLLKSRAGKPAEKEKLTYIG